MVVNTAKMNARQFREMGEDPAGVTLELVNGEVSVSPSPNVDHSNVVMVLAWIIMTHIRSKKLGVLLHDLDTPLDRYNIRRPDMLFFSTERMHLLGSQWLEDVPDLAIEVISPSSVDIDREDKFEQYRAAKIKYYWIADPAMKTLEGWELKRLKYVPIGRAQGSGTIQLAPFPDLQIPLKELWRK